MLLILEVLFRAWEERVVTLSEEMVGMGSVVFGGEVGVGGAWLM